MLVKESVLEENLYSKDMQETTFDEEETISLCDLPLYSDHGGVEWEEALSIESQGSSSLSSPEQDVFEFSSQEFNPFTTAAATATASLPQDSIIFCGKLIPYKQPVVNEKDSSRMDESIKKQVNNKKRRSWGISTRQLQSSNGKKSTTLVHKKDHVPSSLQELHKKICNSDEHVPSSLQELPKKICNSDGCRKGYNIPVHKMSILTSSPSGKARWYLFFFGISSFSTRMELRDMKSRQNRRKSPSRPPSPPASTLTLSTSNQMVSRGRNRGWGFWAVIRALSCGGNHQKSTMVTPFLSCTPSE